MTDQYGFSFARSNLDAKRGPIDPAEEFFRGAVETSVARETIQNSLDVRVGEDPVTVVFELQRVKTNDLPDFSSVKDAIQRSVEETRGQQGHDKMLRAQKAAEQSGMWVLRIGDYGTTGLTGSESIQDGNSPLSALTRGVGVSSSDDSRGGSFGIGSAVGTMASAINTVLYASLPRGSSEVVFAGHTRQASHRDDQGNWFQPDGFFRKLDVDDDFIYMRGWHPVTPFEARTQAGTDTYILAYVQADEDSKLHGIRDEALRSFLVAIDRGELVVKGKTPNDSWELNAENVLDTLENHVDPEVRDEILPFHRALHDEAPAIIEHKKYGRAELYIYEDDSMAKPMGTWTMRQKHMHVATFRHQIHVPYAAILIVSEEPGNGLLRQLEPPQHNAWEEQRAPYGRALVGHLKTSVRECLRERLAVKAGDTAKVKGLGRFLPKAGNGIENSLGTGKPGLADDADTPESATQVGRQEPALTPEIKQQQVRVRVTQTGTSSDSGEVGAQGKDRGGSTKRKSKKAGIPGPVEPKPGPARIAGASVSTRAWQAADGRYRIAVTALEDASGMIELAVLDDTGAPIDDYPLSVFHAETHEGVHVSTDGATLREIDLKAGQTGVYVLSFTNTDRIRLGVR